MKLRIGLEEKSCYKQIHRQVKYNNDVLFPNTRKARTVLSKYKYRSKISPKLFKPGVEEIGAIFHKK